MKNVASHVAVQNVENPKIAVVNASNVSNVAKGVN
jgi:hypothetical protein